MNLWQVQENTFEPKKIYAKETLFTIGNGYLGTRGSFEEGYPRDKPATLLSAVFDRIPIGKEELANVPDWVPIKLFLNGERFRMDRGTILEYQRTLDIKNGVLHRVIRWESPSGIKAKIETERFASLADEHVAAIRYQVTIEEVPAALNGQSVEVSIRASFNSAVGNDDLMHWVPVDQGHEGEIVWLQNETKRTKVQLVQTMSFHSGSNTTSSQIFDSDIAPNIHISDRLNGGETLTAYKIVSFYTSRDGDNPYQQALDHHHTLLNGSPKEPGKIYQSLLDTNKQAWSQYWEVSDILIEGDEIAQIAVRYNIYQLRISTRWNDDRYSVAAKGLTGFGYKGHIFHDTEIFMLPYFTYTHPEVARNLLKYRYNLLPAAREKAAKGGYEGAQYPWESTLDGEEATPESIIHPESGEIIPVLNGHIELHITCSIARAVAEYWRITGDDAFMRDYGAEILLSTAQFWSSRVEMSSDGSSYQITNVIGPDEWHEHVNNNAYTNYLVKWNVEAALNAITWLRQDDPNKGRELLQKLHINDKALDHWRDVTARMYVPQNPETKLIEQFDDFFKLAPMDQALYEGRTQSYQAILGIHGVQQLQIIKQADVLQLLTVANDLFDEKTKKINWDYYFPITDHSYGSSLTPALHAILACELGLPEVAYKMLMTGALVDIEDLRGNAAEGIHDACAGAVWQAVILGVAGLRLHKEGYQTSPQWPREWTRLSFSFKHKGKLNKVDLRRDTN